ncbi:hypothetical protein FAF44_02975 [Nonomuraea sp. MG754425]|uniref:hypothetical protein n=1 Tax=Nonomuraea sp. MG754425 TaxID=2570319 RepID=UPI001F1E1B42|nr:hypothetical protein [Nonomuraea sp. MG754425]MCF6467378.1 hypothetical protein [Nonomuraea sp. MG754425]
MSRPIITAVAEVEALAARRRAGLTILGVNLDKAKGILRGLSAFAPTTVYVSKRDEGVYVEHADSGLIAELREELRVGGWAVR